MTGTIGNLNIRKVVGTLYILVVVCMGYASAVEGVYEAWWFTALWTMLCATGVLYFLKRKVKRPSIVTIHLALVTILAGAFLTHISGSRGMLELVPGEDCKVYYEEKGDEAIKHELPFILCLKNFNIDYHAGTTAAVDYVSTVILKDGKEEYEAKVSINKIHSHKGVRLYQSGYDEMTGCVYLSVNRDPWGIPVTYAGYALLFVSLLWMLVDAKGQFRILLKKSRTFTYLIIFIMGAQPASAQRTLPKEQASELCQLCLVYNDRVCPMQTYAIDFTKKLYGKKSYNGYTAEQVLAGFLFFPDEWKEQPVIKVKSRELREAFGLNEYVSMRRFFSAEDGYILGLALQGNGRGNNDKLEKEILKMDDRIGLIMQLSMKEPLRLFPFNGHWYSPTDEMPADIDTERWQYMQESLAFLRQCVVQKDWSQFSAMVKKIDEYQHAFGKDSLPSQTQLTAEHIYNAIPFVTILFMVCLTMGFISLLSVRFVKAVSLAVLALSLAALTFCHALRWIISGTIPMSNGFETMILMAWMIMIASLVMSRRFPIAVTFGLLLSGFALLTSHISLMDPQIGHVMPVLSSPLLTIHVSIIMTAYSLLALTFISSLFALIRPSLQTMLRVLGGLFLYPAVACLGIGIFTGAIWANVSWGTYWSWDPKETWALITFMIYAIPLHTKSVTTLNNERAYHLFMVVAFLSVIMTYFGVNYLMSGMHSYA